jgi:hypothetical protein
LGRRSGIETTQKEHTMTHHIDARQKAFEAKQYGVLRAIDANGRLAAGVLAQREQLEKHMAESAARRQLGPIVKEAGPVRRWLGARLVAVGTRLAGAQANLQTGTTRVEEQAATHATP